jgi:hypothetical protein
LVLEESRSRTVTEGEKIPPEYRGWWRITETSQWSSKYLDDIGPALLSLTGYADRLRMHCLLAYVNCKPTKTGISFTWEGAWEFDQMSGSGRVTLGKDGRLKGVLRIKGSDGGTFVAERSVEPKAPIPFPPRYRDKWKR